MGNKIQNSRECWRIFCKEEEDKDHHPNIYVEVQQTIWQYLGAGSLK